MSAMFSPSVSRPLTCTERTAPEKPRVHQLKTASWSEESSGARLHLSEGLRAATHHVVINGEVVVELDDALGLHLELPVGVLGPPLLDVAVPVVLASWGPGHMASEGGGGRAFATPHIIFYTFLRTVKPRADLGGPQPPIEPSRLPSQPTEFVE